MQRRMTMSCCRVYDNARANAIMQKAITVHNIWEKLPKRQKKAFHKYIHRQCSPLDVPEQARDDSVATDDMNEMTFLINVGAWCSEC